MANNYNITIQCNAGKPLASWSLNGKTPALIDAQVGDTLTFDFRLPDSPPATLSSATLFSGPRKPEEGSSPFQQKQIQLAQGAQVKIQNKGFYGFAIAFTTTDQDGVNNFFFLPDPELEVGST